MFLVKVKIIFQQIFFCRFVIQTNIKAMRILLKAFLVLMTTCFFVHDSSAQRTPAKKPVSTVQKFKAPKLYTFLSSYKDSVTIPLPIAESIIAAKLQVFDDKKNEYAITSYQFLYRKRTITEDEQTGKTSPASSIVSDRFTTTPLAALWVNKIREELKTGEELYFFDVIAKDTQGRVMYASSLKIIVQ